MEQKELDRIIKLHEKWLNGEHGGKRADLINADLRNLDLSDADLGYADLHYANLSYTNSSNANLSDAILMGANLRYANLSGAILSGAILSFTDLSGANLSDAILSYADLSNSNLRDAILSKAILNRVNWHEAEGIDVYVAGLQSSRHNDQLAYIPSLDVATTGCWQNTWEATKKRVADVYKGKNEQIYHKYQIAFQYIEDQMEADKNE